MAEVPMLLYIVVVDEEENGGGRQMDSSSSASFSSHASPPHSFRYTRPMLQSTLQLMGCKARHAFKISRRVFAVCRTDCLSGNLTHAVRHISALLPTESTDTKNDHIVGDDVEGVMMPFDLYKSLTTVMVAREVFLNVVCEALSEYKYVGPNQRADLVLACRIRERKESFTILLSGTSGCGKSTLSALLVKEDFSVSGSEESEDEHDIDSDEDVRDVVNKRIDEEMEGSVDEDSMRSDEEYEDLATRDRIQNGYSSDDDEPNNDKHKTENVSTSGDEQEN